MKKNKTKKLCCIFNYAPHYRLPIYKKIDEECQASFYFGNRLLSDEQIKKLNYSQLQGFRRELNVHPIKLGGITIEYTTGWLRLAFNSNYKQFLITPNQFAINQWFFLIVCFFLRKDVYVWMHGLKSKKISQKSLWLSKMYDFFLKGSFLYGNHSRNNMIELGFNPNKLHVVYNSLNYTEPLYMRNKDLENPYISLFNNDFPILLFIGRLTKVKKLHMILQAISLLSERGYGVNVIFIGDGPLRESLESTMRSQGINNCYFSGALYDEKEIAKYLYYADLCISPGNVGLTAIHALSYGLPVITNDNFDTQMPEFEAIEQGVSGDFFIEDDITDLVDKIINWVDKNKDRNAVRERCYQMIDTKFNPNYQVQVFKEVLEN